MYEVRYDNLYLHQHKWSMVFVTFCLKYITEWMWVNEAFFDFQNSEYASFFLCITLKFSLFSLSSYHMGDQLICVFVLSSFYLLKIWYLSMVITKIFVIFSVTSSVSSSSSIPVLWALVMGILSISFSGVVVSNEWGWRDDVKDGNDTFLIDVLDFFINR